MAFNLSPVFGVTTASWVLPDGPLDCALLGAALCLLHALAARHAAWRWWAGAGLCAGLALFSKYTAVLTILGAIAYLLASPHRRWLVRPQPYLAGLIALAVFAPVIAWNAAHHWASFAFQGDRAAGLDFRPGQPFVVLAGEALFVLPWIWLGMLAAVASLTRRGLSSGEGLLCALAAPPIVAFALVALWSSHRVLFHWAAPGYLMLFPLLGAWLAARPRLAVRGLAATAAIVLAGVLTVATDVRFDWLHAAFARDPIIEAIDWTSVRDELHARGLLPPGTVVGVPDWRDAGKIAYALGPDNSGHGAERGRPPVWFRGAGRRLYRPPDAAAGHDARRPCGNAARSVIRKPDSPPARTDPRCGPHAGRSGDVPDRPNAPMAEYPALRCVRQ